tara:strand:- start:1927 stop:2379 length:453 start_codon:yes stop_codon:yes gene_type:complete
MNKETKVIFALVKVYGNLTPNKLRDLLGWDLKTIECSLNQLEISKALEKKHFKPQIFGHSKIDELLDGIKLILKIDDYKESRQYQRMYGKHLVNLCEKIGDEEFKLRFKAIYMDTFKRRNMNSLKFIYSELKSFIPKQDGIESVQFQQIE